MIALQINAMDATYNSPSIHLEQPSILNFWSIDVELWVILHKKSWKFQVLQRETKKFCYVMFGKEAQDSCSFQLRVEPIHRGRSWKLLLRRVKMEEQVLSSPLLW